MHEVAAADVPNAAAAAAAENLLDLLLWRGADVRPSTVIRRFES